jgi:hypothetical protein
VPELPEIRALAERLDAALRGRLLSDVVALGFSGLKTLGRLEPRQVPVSSPSVRDARSSARKKAVVT